MSVAPSAEQGSLPGRDARTASLTFRLVVYVALVLALGSAGVAVAALAYGHRAAQQAYDRLLVGAANAIAGSISVRGRELVVDLPTSAFELLALAPDDRVVYAVFGPDGSLITGYEGIAAQRRPGFSEGDFGGEPARFASVQRPFSERSFSGPVEVVVGQTTRARAELAGEITRSALGVVVVVGIAHGWPHSLRHSLGAPASASDRERPRGARAPRPHPARGWRAGRDPPARRRDQPLHGAAGAAVRDHGQPDRRRFAPAPDTDRGAARAGRPRRGGAGSGAAAGDGGAYSRPLGQSEPPHGPDCSVTP